MRMLSLLASHYRKEKMIRGVKGSKIKERSFKFDGDKIKHKLDYQGNGKAPDKRFDLGCEGLSLFIYPSGTKVFYAFKLVEMYNRKKGKTEKNCLYKKMFRYQDIQGYKYRDAKDKLKEALDGLNNPIKKDESELLFKDLAKQFLKEGMEGPRLDDPDLMYKASSKVRYTQYIKSYLLLKHPNKNKIKALTETIIYKNKTSNRPIGDYLCSEITLWHVEVLRERLKDIPTSADDAVQMVSVIYKWAIVNNILKRENPCKHFAWKTNKPFKAKLLDSDTAKLKNYIQSKAFDFEPHFLTCVGLHLFTGQRSLDIFGLRWESPVSEEEKEACSGWLVDGWETATKPSFHIWSTKTHQPADIYLDQVSVALLKRLREANLRDRNAWALKSCYVFPRSKNPAKYVVYGSYQKRLVKLNKVLGFVKLEGDNISRTRGKRKIFTMKIARKTLATEIARNKGGIELAARKLNHSSSAITRRNYIVPDDPAMEIENLYEKNLPDNDVIIVKEDKKSPWGKK